MCFVVIGGVCVKCVGLGVYFCWCGCGGDYFVCGVGVIVGDV